MKIRICRTFVLKFGSQRTLKIIAVLILFSTLGFHLTRMNIAENTQLKEPRNIDKDGKDYGGKRQVIPSYSENENLILIYKTPSWLLKTTKSSNFIQCEISNCILTEDTKLLRFSKAVIFHGRFLPENAPFKYENQFWVFLELESPYYTPLNYSYPQWRKSFDLTMTYRSDSDIFYPYGRIVKKENNTIVPLNHIEIMSKKEKMAFWMVSHCGAISERDEYAKRLQQYIPVDIYGKCGTLSCTKNILKCYMELSKIYKFYFAFENSLCEDYYTEKIYFSYYKDVNMIAIVRGASGYGKYFPPGTYIDTADFKHPKDLANFLLDLNSDDEKYLAYLKRKNEYKNSITLAEMFKKSLCDLCRIVNKKSKTSKQIDIKEWILESKCYQATDLNDGI